MTRQKQDLPYLSHLLGFYDYVDPPQVYTVAGETHNIDAIAIHEEAHQWLAEHSTVGILLRGLILALKVEPGAKLLEEIANLVAAETEEVQEGFASYVEYAATQTRMSLETFRNELSGLPEIYLTGFDLARKIERIFVPEDFPSLSELELNTIRMCALIDLARFAMNVPVPKTDDDSQVVAAIQANSPNDRWRYLLEILSNDHKRRKALIDLIRPMVTIWLEKNTNRFSGKHYTGILVDDNIESVIAEVFPALAYQAPHNAWFIKVGPPGPELTAEYLMRENTAELKLSPSTQLKLQRELKLGDLCSGFTRLASSGSGACFVRLVPAQTAEARIVDIGHPLTIPKGFTAVLVHEAVITFDETGGRWWNYQGVGVATLISTNSVFQLLDSLDWDDAVVVIDCDLRSDDPFEPLLWSGHKTPLFLKTTPTGSAAAIIRTLSDQRLRIGTDVVTMVNWLTFVGAGSDQILLMWAIPYLSNQQAAIVLFATEPVIASIERWKTYVEGLEAVRMVKEKRAVIVPPLPEEAKRWRITDNDSIVHAPTNADIATAHLLSFGW